MLLVDYMITAPCNLDCPFCYGPKRETLDINFKDKTLLLDGLCNHGVTNIVFAGGEPLLSKDFLVTCSYAYGLGLAIGLQTNGFILDVLERSIPYLDWVGLPLDGISEATQIKMRTSKKHLDYFNRSYELLKDSIINKKVKLKVGTVISAYNIGELEEMAAYLTNFSFSIWKLYQIRERGMGKHLSQDFFISSNALKKQLEFFADSHQNYNIHISYQTKNSDAYLILNPDSELLVIDGFNTISYGKLMEQGRFLSTNFEEAKKHLNIANHRKNIYNSFPGWDSKHDQI